MSVEQHAQQPRRGRDIMLTALREYRAAPNRDDAEKVMAGVERMLKALDAAEKRVAERDAQQAGLAEENHDQVAPVYDELVWAAYEEHQLRHDGPWQICVHMVCRQAGPLLDEALPRLHESHTPLVVRTWA